LSASSGDNRPVALVTDYAWPDLDIERSILAAAGIALAAGPGPLIQADQVTDLVRAHDPAAILTNWAVVNEDAVAAPSALRVVTRLGVGLDNIATSAVRARGAVVTNVPDYCVEEVSDHAVGLLLDWARGISRFSAEVRAGLWAPQTARLHRVADLTVALLGLGRIGSRTAAKLAPFGCTLLGVNRSGAMPPGVRAATLPQALEAADVVIVHLPGAPETKHLLNAAAFARLRPGALVINVGRGAVIDTDALVAALASGQVGAAALDVLETEPEPAPALRDDPRVVITPHIAFTSSAALADLRRKAAEDVVRVLTFIAPLYPCP